MSDQIKTGGVAIAWEGLPVYGARLIAAGRKQMGAVPLAVLGTRPAVPLKGIEEELGQRVFWLDRKGRPTWEKLGVPVPRLFLHTGWAYRYFNILADEVRSAGGTVVSMVDNRWKANARQLIGALYFRWALRRRFDALWVPGRSGVRLARFLGMPLEKVKTGMYGADSRHFFDGPALAERSRRFLYVGQYVARKGVDLLAQAWPVFASRNPEWELVCFGEGPLEGVLRQLPRTRVNPFLQPGEISAAMREARFLVLPSRDDHWGLVVHEAALSGCGLLVSAAVGAAGDLVEAENGRVFQAVEATALAEALEWAGARRNDELSAIQNRSRRLADKFGPDVWAAGLVDFAKKSGIQR